MKPDFWPHRMHSRLSEAAALVALALLNYADDDGRFEADPEAIKSCLFPRRALTKTVAECLEELRATRWIVLYDGKVDGEPARIGQVTKFADHQVINKHRPSTFPAPPDDLIRDAYGNTTVALPDASRTTTTPIPTPRNDGSRHGEGRATASENDRLLRSLEGREGGERSEGEGAREAHFPEPVWPTEAEVLTECELRGFDKTAGQKFWLHFEAMSPKWSSGGKPIGEWRKKLRGWMLNEPGKNPGKNGGEAAPGGRELVDIQAEMQWQKQPDRLEVLKKRAAELRAA